MAIVLPDGTSIAYTDRGAGEPPFVFVPSWACDATVWVAQVEALAPSHRCLAIDPRGRGDSAPVPPFGIRTWADDVAAVVRAKLETSAIIAGHSLGAIVALLANHRNPALFCGVVVVDPPLNAAAEGRLAGLATAIREAGSMRDFDDYVESFFSESTPATARALVRDLMLGCPPDIAAGQLEDAGFLTEAIARLVGDADLKPFMAVWPEEPLGNPERLRDLTRFLRQEPVAGAGHFVMLDRPEVFTALLRDFVDEVLRDPRLNLIR